MKVTVIGGGLAGLVAAVELAERGCEVAVHERAKTLGGRARTSVGPYRANFGPHAVYRDGALWSWLGARGLLPPTRASNPLTVRFVWRERLRRTPPRPVLDAMRLALHDAPDDVGYRRWIEGRVSPARVDGCCRVACFYTFAHDPGRLSAAFVNQRNRRLVVPPSPARFVSRGGWQAIVDAIAAHAAGLGVEILTSSRVDALPPPPVVVAVEPGAAASLLGTGFAVPHARAVLLDVAVERRRREPSAVLDLDGGAFIERYTAFDAKLAPDGEELLQCHAGVGDDEDADEALARIERALDLAFTDWRRRERWRATRRSDGRSGAVELPESPWRGRPAPDRGGGVFLAGDWVAAPGLLSEVAVTSAVEAAAAAGAFGKA